MQFGLIPVIHILWGTFCYQKAITSLLSTGKLVVQMNGKNAVSVLFLEKCSD